VVTPVAPQAVAERAAIGKNKMTTPSKKKLEARLEKIFERQFNQKPTKKNSRFTISVRAWIGTISASLLSSVVIGLLVYFLNRPKVFNPGHLMMKVCVSTGSGFISTGVLQHSAGKALYLSAANIDGEIFTLDEKGHDLFRRKMRAPVIAPLTLVGQHLFAVDQNLSGTMFSNNGDRLWDVRSELGFSGSIAKTLSISSKNNELLVILEKSGRVLALDSRYGLKKWELTDPAFTAGGTLPSPIFYNGLIYLLSKSGTVMALESETGRIKWSTELKDNFRSSPLICPYAVGASKLLAVSEHGKICVMDGQTGETFSNSSFELGHPMASSPLLISRGLSHFALMATADGHLLKINVDQARIEGDFFSGTNFESYPATPALLQIEDQTFAVCVNNHGDLTILDTATWKAKLPIYPLGREVSASVLTADMDQNGDPEIVVLAENGDIVILEWSLSGAQLQKTWPEFLGGSAKH
jgi:hypothetical protein